MALPTDVVRSYGGGAVAAQLVDPIGPSDTSFTLTTTVGWTEPGGTHLGTSGPFVVVIDRFAGTVEKILCSAVNLSTDVVTVWTSGGSGRGYDGSTPQAHVPNGSPSGVQTTWSAIEAAEANQAVAYILGTLGGTPSNGQVLRWNGSNPTWAAASPLTGQPSGLLSAISQDTVTGSAAQVLGLSASGPHGYLLGGMTGPSSTLVVPTTGAYKISWQVTFQNSGSSITASGQYVAGVAVNTVGAARAQSWGQSGQNPTAGSSIDLQLTAGDALSIFVAQDSGTNQGTAYNGFGATGAGTYISATLGSQ